MHAFSIPALVAAVVASFSPGVLLGITHPVPVLVPHVLALPAAISPSIASTNAAALDALEEPIIVAHFPIDATFHSHDNFFPFAFVPDASNPNTIVFFDNACLSFPISSCSPAPGAIFLLSLPFLALALLFALAFSISDPHRQTEACAKSVESLLDKPKQEVAFLPVADPLTISFEAAETVTCPKSVESPPDESKQEVAIPSVADPLTTPSEAAEATISVATTVVTTEASGTIDVSDTSDVLNLIAVAELPALLTQDDITLVTTRDEIPLHNDEMRVVRPDRVRVVTESPAKPPPTSSPVRGQTAPGHLILIPSSPTPAGAAVHRILALPLVAPHACPAAVPRASPSMAPRASPPVVPHASSAVLPRASPRVSPSISLERTAATARASSVSEHQSATESGSLIYRTPPPPNNDDVLYSSSGSFVPHMQRLPARAPCSSTYSSRRASPIVFHGRVQQPPLHIARAHVEAQHRAAHMQYSIQAQYRARTHLPSIAQGRAPGAR